MRVIFHSLVYFAQYHFGHNAQKISPLIKLYLQSIHEKVIIPISMAVLTFGSPFCHYMQIFLCNSAAQCMLGQPVHYYVLELLRTRL